MLCHCICFKISEISIVHSSVNKMKGRLLKIAAVWLLLACLIDSCFSTLSKSDRGKKKKKEEAQSDTKVFMLT